MLETLLHWWPAVHAARPIICAATTQQPGGACLTHLVHAAWASSRSWLARCILARIPSSSTSASAAASWAQLACSASSSSFLLLQLLVSLTTLQAGRQHWQQHVGYWCGPATHAPPAATHPATSQHRCHTQAAMHAAAATHTTPAISRPNPSPTHLFEMSSTSACSSRTSPPLCSSFSVCSPWI